MLNRAALNIQAVNAGIPTPTISLSPTSATFTATAGGGNPAATTIAVTNTGGGTLGGLNTGILYNNGVVPWLNVSLSSTTAPATLTLTATTGSLAAGTYSATVSVQTGAAGVTNSPQSIPVTFTVEAAAVIVPPFHALRGGFQLLSGGF